MTTRDYNNGMKPTLSSRLTDGLPFESAAVNDISLLGSEQMVSVRTAKAQLSSLLDLVEQGREVVITSNGKPKARLVSAEAGRKSKPFAFSAGFQPVPWRGGSTADELVREDRDSRGW
ncbi:MAG: type II toxin-antitoxin system prevent-host-death family antitoxin [Chthoniobacterales bacterium]